MREAISVSELVWIKSSFSEAGGNNCVEIAVDGENIAIRDSTAPGIHITVGRAAFGSFMTTTKAGDCDRLPG
ncbi:DUF397 domain-containing protein [Streptomyces sp. TRM 70361]|uniref:DUF397 domain-containing protein n=1 Tax=Streptomyces sp. TRM 70361 TaxID=3116553 RepID=UPI002E7C3524|nr:DUF397 domain-containing protein [Streptomyces sp. TRM 70361]MEE1938661.1 DUF397 domain-containing protein [Streptomyces sp. TRM 70361]